MADQPQLLLAPEPVEELFAGADAALPVAAAVLVVVISVPAGDTSHHLAPNPSLPCPAVLLALESPTK